MVCLFSDEDFPLPIIELLRDLGHDLLTAREAGNANLQIPSDRGKRVFPLIRFPKKLVGARSDRYKNFTWLFPLIRLPKKLVGEKAILKAYASWNVSINSTSEEVGGNIDAERAELANSGFH